MNQVGVTVSLGGECDKETVRVTACDSLRAHIRAPLELANEVNLSRKAREVRTDAFDFRLSRIGLEGEQNYVS
jgi:hypothetical protein